MYRFLALIFIILGVSAILICGRDDSKNNDTLSSDEEGYQRIPLIRDIDRIPNLACSPEPARAVGPGWLIKRGETVTLGLDPIEGHTYRWYDSKKVLISTESKVEVQPVETERYALTTANVCGSTTSEVTVYVGKQ